jgi:hypothetical protein
MVNRTLTSVLLPIVAIVTLAALPAEGVVSARVTRFSGTAHGIGLGEEQAGIQIVGRFTTPSPFHCNAHATAILLAVIGDPLSPADVVGVFFDLVVTENSATTCTFENVPPGGPTPPPFVRLAVRQVAEGVYNFRLEVTEATRAGIPSPPCPTVALETRFLLDDGQLPLILVSAQPNWTCSGTGNRYLKTP